MTPLTVLDLFAGIGGFSLGLERTGGFETTAFVEIDPFCQRVLAKHWPGVSIHDDIKTREFREGEADVITGGFPCQDISLAGRRAGLAGSRSGLYGQLVRALRVVRPKHAIVENVAALLSDGMGVVLGDLAEGGIDSEWDCVPALAIGAPHERDRVFIVAHPHGFDGWPTDGAEKDGGEAGHGVDPAAPVAPDALGDGLEACDGLRRQLSTERTVGGAETRRGSGDTPDADCGGRSSRDERPSPAVAGDAGDQRRQATRHPEQQRCPDQPSDPSGDGRGPGREGRFPDSFARVRVCARRSASDPYGARYAFRQGYSRDPRQESPTAERSGDGNEWQSIWPDEPALSGMDDVIPDWVDRVKTTGNAILPPIAEMIGLAILDQMR